MRISKLVEGEIYRLKNNKAGYVRVLKVLKPKADITYRDINGNFAHDINPKTYTIVKCEHTSGKDSPFGFIRYFKPSDIEEIK